MGEKLTPFGATVIIEAEAGTVVRDPRTGEEAVVEEGSALCLGNRMWLTPANYDRVRAALSRKEGR